MQLREQLYWASHPPRRQTHLAAPVSHIPHSLWHKKPLPEGRTGRATRYSSLPPLQSGPKGFYLQAELWSVAQSISWLIFGACNVLELIVSRMNRIPLAESQDPSFVMLPTLSPCSRCGNGRREEPNGERGRDAGVRLPRLPRPFEATTHASLRLTPTRLLIPGHT